MPGDPVPAPNTNLNLAFESEAVIAFSTSWLVTVNEPEIAALATKVMPVRVPKLESNLFQLRVVVGFTEKVLV